MRIRAGWRQLGRPLGEEGLSWICMWWEGINAEAGGGDWMVEQTGQRALDGEKSRNKSPEAGFSRSCARNLPLDLLGWGRGARWVNEGRPVWQGMPCGRKPQDIWWRPCSFGWNIFSSRRRPSWGLMLNKSLRSLSIYSLHTREDTKISPPLGTRTCVF